MRQQRLARLVLLALAGLLLTLGAAACKGWLRPQPQPVNLSAPVRDRLRDGTYAIRYVVIVRRPGSRSADGPGAQPNHAGVDTAPPVARHGEAAAADTARPPRTYGPRDQVQHSDPADSLASFVEDQGGMVRHRFTAALYGFSAALPDSVVAMLLRDPGVVSVTPVVRGTTAGEVQQMPPWGLDRIDQPDSVLDKQYVYGRTGRGVSVYVIDTGIRASHYEFREGGRKSRAEPLYTAVRRHGDDDGHGTHVAGTIAGTTYGVSKQARLWSVRVSRTRVYESDNLIEGIDEVILGHAKPAVINISLIGPADVPTDLAVAAAVNSGITVVTAAGSYTVVTATGKSYANACSYSPARAAEGITVAGSRRADELYSLTSVGSCVDVFAPAVGILSAGIGSDTHSVTREGTSMAAAHVTGAVALYLEANPTATPAQVAAHLLTCTALQDRLVGVPTGTWNRLVFTGTPATAAAGCATPLPS